MVNLRDMVRDSLQELEYLNLEGNMIDGLGYMVFKQMLDKIVLDSGRKIEVNAVKV